MLFKVAKNKRTKSDFFIMTIIVSSPFLFFLYNLVPENQKWNTYFFTIDAGYYENADYYVWLLLVRIFTILILSLWFLTIFKKWRYILFLPILVEISKISRIILEAKFDHIENGIMISSLMITIIFPVLLILFWLNKKLKFQEKNKSHLIINEEINTEIEKLSNFKVETYESVKHELAILDSMKPNLSQKEYLIKLLSLRERLNSL